MGLSKPVGNVDSVATWVYKRFTQFLWLFTVWAFLGLIVWLGWSLRANHVETHDAGLIVAGLFVTCGLPISIWEIGMHLRYYTRPDLQKFIIRILWMVPIYSVFSWFSLLTPAHAVFFNTVRGCYEAYVIYSFYMYLVTFLGDLHGEDQIIDLLERKQNMEYDHMVPFCWMPKTRMGEPFLHMCRRGVIAYVAIRLFTALASFALELGGIYGEGQIDFNRGYVYLSMMNNMAAMWGLYCLFAFYTQLQEELAPIKPGTKFICVKLVVFFSYWQGFLIAMLAYSGVLHKITSAETGLTSWHVTEVQIGCQNFLICCEMFFAAIAHLYAFSYREFAPVGEGYIEAHSRPLCDMVWVMLDLEDFTRDFHNETSDLREVSATAQYHLGEQSRLLKTTAHSIGPVKWVLQTCFGMSFEEETPPVSGEETRILAEDYGRDDNAWADTP